jgi:hypothetical protein
MTFRKTILVTAAALAMGLAGTQAAKADWYGHGPGYGDHGGRYFDGRGDWHGAGWFDGYRRWHFYPGFYGVPPAYYAPPPAYYAPPPPAYYAPPPAYYAPPPVYVAPPIVTFGFRP